VVDIWLFPSTFQRSKLKNENLDSYILPNYIDEKLFYRKDKSKKELCNKFNIDYMLIKDKTLIGSFQRDSLGVDLTIPKPEKGSDNLVEILNDSRVKKNCVLLLAGPRRHYLINKCKEFKIPFIFLGDSKIVADGYDDVNQNIRDWKEMPDLYNLIDLYLVTSRSEGGPNAILEAAWCKTLIFSSRVGLAEDFLSEECLYDKISEAQKKVVDFSLNFDSDIYQRAKQVNYQRVKSRASHEKYKQRLDVIYKRVTKEIGRT